MRRAYASRRAALAVAGACLASQGCLVEFPERAATADADLGAVARLDALIGQGEAGPVGGSSTDAFTGTGPRPPRDARSEPADAAGGAFVKPDAGRPMPDDGPATDAAPIVVPPEADAGPPPPPPVGVETCDGVDENGDGEIDENAGCGRFIQSNCSAWLVWANGEVAPGPVTDFWSACPALPEAVGYYHTASIGCNSTRPDGRFRPVTIGPWGADLNDNDWLGVAFRCDPAAGPVAARLQAQCRVFLGQADFLGVDVQPDDADTWGACPAANESARGPLQCVGSGGDGRFHAMQLFGDVDYTDRFGIAFRCDAPPGASPAEQRWAGLMTAAVRVFFTYAYWFPPEDNNGWDVWGECPGADLDAEGDERCVSSGRDGRFHALTMDGIPLGDVDYDDTLGIALLAADE
ncbi:hypothetical protein L6V77_04430 [Myxococcota bacterium]|nr:hypothetical protein [Myxococcota bacterium]